MSARFPECTYGVILADPPWAYSSKVHAKMGKYAEDHYPTMKTQAIADLPVASIAHSDSFLFLWATPPNLIESLWVMTAWGFRYITIAFTWVKTNPKKGNYFYGIGAYTRSNAEHCLLGKRGHPDIVSSNASSLIVSPRRQHSRKPDEQYARIETLCGEIPRIELFARHRQSGWDSWGNELTNQCYED